MLTNGTPDAEVSLPKQFVRLRILNAEMERAYNLGFSDNRTFYVIANDGGLVNTPVAVTRVIMAVGERVEILVDMSNDVVGSSIDIKAYNSGFALGFPGGEPNTSGQFGSLLNNIDFNVLHINVSATTANPITTMPAVLANNVYWTASDATVNRTVSVTGGQGPVPFTFDNTAFDLGVINKIVQLNDIEKRTITNNQIFGHSFHIHDVQLKLVSRSTGTVEPYESGWKDTFYLPRNTSATFVAKFDDYADPIHPFMYHCHFSNHEDAGMMGQFVVEGTPENVSENTTIKSFSLYPNPASAKLFVAFEDASMQAYYVKILSATGRTVLMLPRPLLQGGIDISSLAPGVYVLELTDEKTKTIATQKFIVE